MVALHRLTLGGRSALILLTAIGEASRATQALAFYRADAFTREATHRLCKRWAIKVTAARAIRVRLFSAGNRENNQGESDKTRAKGSHDVSSGHVEPREESNQRHCAPQRASTLYQMGRAAGTIAHLSASGSGAYW
jgi:hypothetical protein